MEDKLFDILKRNMSFIKYTDKEIIFRCPICGDSKNPYHGHFYIQNEEPHKFICFKCNTRGNDIVQFLLNLNKDIDLNDKQYLLRYLMSKKKKNINNSEEYVNQYENLNFDLLKKLTRYRPDTIEIETMKKVYGDYLYSRIPDKNHIDYLISKKIIIPFYSSEEHKINSYSPDIILNRIYFKVNNSIFISRQVSKHLELNDIFKKQKYVIYRPKNYEGSIPPFEMKSDVVYTTNPITLFLVEGVFDAIILDYFLKITHSSNYIIHTINTKVIKQINLDYIKQNGIFNVVFIPDSDVSLKDIQTSVNKILRLDNNINVFIGKNESDYKDVGEFKSIEDFKNIKIMNHEKFFVLSQIGLDFKKKFCYN